MLHEGFTPQLRTIGRVAAWSVFVLIMIYAVILVLGLLSLQSPQDPIGDPFFTLLELLIPLIALAMVIAMVAMYVYAAPEVKVYSGVALAMIILLAGLTSSVHFVVLTVSRPLEATGLSWVPLLISFTWPSVIYALDILAWDWFFALSMLFAAPVFKGGRLETTVRILLLVSGLLSLAGLVGVPLADMQVRLIGVVGYVGVAPFAFLLMGVIFGRAQPTQEDVRNP